MVEPFWKNKILTEGVLIAMSEIKNMRSLICIRIGKPGHSPSKPAAI